MKKVLSVILSLCLLATSCGLTALPAIAETIESESGVNLIGYYNKQTGTVKTSDYDSSAMSDLNLSTQRGGFTYSYPPMTPPIAAEDTSKNSSVKDSGYGVYTAAQLTQTVANFQDPQNAAYGSWLACAGDSSNKKYLYSNGTGNVPFLVLNSLLVPAGRTFIRAVAGMQNGHTYRISVDHISHDGKTGRTLYLGFNTNKTAWSTETPNDSGAIAATSAWQTATFTVKNTFTANNGITYLLLRVAGDKVRIKNLSIVDLTKEISVTSNNTKLGVASSSVGTALVGEEVTLTATPYGDAAFEGWFNGDTLVSRENPYTFTVTGSVNYTAKFSSQNLIGTGTTTYDSPTFEELSAGTVLKIDPKQYDSDTELTATTPASGLTNTLEAFKNSTETCGQWIPQYIKDNQLVYAYGGWDAALKVVANPVSQSTVNTSAKCLKLGYQSRYFVRRVDGLTPGMTYKFSFKYYVGTEKQDKVFDAALLNQESAFKAVIPAANKVGFNASTDWATAEFVYQHPADATDNFAFIKLAEIDTHDAGDAYYIDDLSLIPMQDTAVVDEMVQFSGNAMRTTGNQALRFKFYVPDEFKTAGGYVVYNKDVAELGFLVQYSAVLGGKELVLGGKYTYNDIEFGVNSGIGYQKDGVNTVFETKDGKTYYSAALTNIGVKSNGTVNYKYYEQDLCVRPYVKLADGTVLYGETQKSSVFATLQYILDESHTEVAAADREAVTSLLTNNLDLKEAYEAWNP